MRRLFRHIKCFRILSILVLLCCSLWADAQYFDIAGSRKRVDIPFRMLRDLIIVKLKINGKGPFNFVIDSGVGLMLITDSTLVDSINIPNKRTIRMTGLDRSDVFEAYVTSPLNVQIPGLASYDVAAAILKSDPFGLSNYAGIPIQGLLGYEFFSNLAVKIDFGDSIMTVSRPKDTRFFRRGRKIPMTIENRKPYLHARVVFPNGNRADEKLIMDLGAGHPLMLYNSIKKQGMPENFIAANLGVGLTGPITGFLSRVKEVDIGKFRLKKVITSLPTGDQDAQLLDNRDGNLGLGILKRFTLIVDYPDSALYLKAGPKLREPFEHDMSGLEYFSAGKDLSHVIISRVEPGSPADEVGLEPGDEIISINFKPVAQMTLEQIDAVFKSKPGRSLLLRIYHDKRYDNVVIILKRRI